MQRERIDPVTDVAGDVHAGLGVERRVRAWPGAEGLSPEVGVVDHDGDALDAVVRGDPFEDGVQRLETRLACGPEPRPLRCLDGS